ncbi:hypothetical protein ACNO5E_08795 [Vibrio parahaemolyticus]|uniref:hypothetical protein n=1 Tax=Vibrio parahaemolyticus TaxID=670 RepID=UPI000812CCA4|nr:hypothetical protein [Vibrio parahaemolyticus]OCP68287.1 hypothetical protein AKH08_15835 [Vibrio parahaemolyticus]
MTRTFIVGARSSDIARSTEFIAIITVTNEEQLNRRLQSILQNRTNLGKKKLLLQAINDLMVQFSNSRIKPTNMFLTSPSLMDSDKQQILSNSWMTVEEARLLLRKAYVRT